MADISQERTKKLEEVQRTYKETFELVRSMKRDGHSNVGIARAVGISESTVRIMLGEREKNDD